MGVVCRECGKLVPDNDVGKHKCYKCPICNNFMYNSICKTCGNNVNPKTEDLRSIDAIKKD